MTSNRWPRRLCLAVLFCSIGDSLGCVRGAHSPSDAKQAEARDEFHVVEHDVNEKKPKDYGAAVETIKRLLDQIAEHSTARHVDQLREPVKDLQDVLRWLPEIAADSELNEHDWNQVSAAARSLQKAMAQFADALEHNRPLPLDAVRQEAEAPVGRLAGFVTSGAWLEPSFPHEGLEPAGALSKAGPPTQSAVPDSSTANTTP